MAKKSLYVKIIPKEAIEKLPPKYEHAKFKFVRDEIKKVFKRELNCF